MDGKTNFRKSDFLSRAKTFAIGNQQQLGNFCTNGKQLPTHEFTAIERQTGAPNCDGATCWIPTAFTITLHEASAAVENLQRAGSCRAKEN
jgi:hypothetical protein